MEMVSYPRAKREKRAESAELEGKVSNRAGKGWAMKRAVRSSSDV